MKDYVAGVESSVKSKFEEGLREVKDRIQTSETGIERSIDGVKSTLDVKTSDLVETTETLFADTLKYLQVILVLATTAVMLSAIAIVKAIRK